MKRDDALPGKYLSKLSFDPAVLCVVDDVTIEEISGDGRTERKPVLYIREPSSPVDVTRGVVLNGTNWDALESICGSPDSDDWKGKQVVLYHDPNVMFGRERKGGIRIRAPRQQAQQAPAAPAQQQAPAPPPPAQPDHTAHLDDDSVPF